MASHQLYLLDLARTIQPHVTSYRRDEWRQFSFTTTAIDYSFWEQKYPSPICAATAHFWVAMLSSIVTTKELLGCLSHKSQYPCKLDFSLRMCFLPKYLNTNNFQRFQLVILSFLTFIVQRKRKVRLIKSAFILPWHFSPTTFFWIRGARQMWHISEQTFLGSALQPCWAAPWQTAAMDQRAERCGRQATWTVCC